MYDLKKKTWTLIPNMLQQGSNGGGVQSKEVSSASGLLEIS